MAKIDDSVWTLRHEIERCTTHADSIRALIRGLHLRLGQAIAADNQAVMQASVPRPAGVPVPARTEPFANTQALLDAIGAQSDNLAAAVLANTPPTVTAPVQTPEEKAAIEKADVDARTKAAAIVDAETAVRGAATDDERAAAAKKLADAEALPDGTAALGAAVAGWQRSGAAA